MMRSRGIASVAALCTLAALAGAGAASADDRADEFRLTVFPSHPILGSRQWIGAGYLGYVSNNDKGIETGYLGTGTIWKFAPWAEAWLFLIGTKTEADDGPDSDELRPFLAFKSMTRPAKTTYFSLARLEYRILGTEGQPDREYWRLRERLGLETPFGGQAYAPHTWYGLTDAEAYYRTDRDLVDLARLRAGIGFVVSDFVRAEFIYHMQLTRAEHGDDFDWTDNIFRLNFKIVRQRGLLGRLGHYAVDADD